MKDSVILGGLNYFMALVIKSNKNMVRILLLSIIINSSLLGQNLIPNSSFEEYNYCPNNFLKVRSSFKKCLPGWYSPTKGTPDYFNTCSRYKADVPNNFAGISKPKTGNGYIGFGLITDPYSTNGWYFSQEYIATELISPLIKGQLYCIQFYISLADYSKYYTDEIGVFFSNNKIRKNTKRNLPYEPQVNFITQKINNDEDWIKICGKYYAIGGESYMAIGNFKIPDFINFYERELEKIRKINVSYSGYYYIDDVSLFEITDESECECIENEKEFTID